MSADGVTDFKDECTPQPVLVDAGFDALDGDKDGDALMAWTMNPQALLGPS